MGRLSNAQRAFHEIREKGTSYIDNIVRGKELWFECDWLEFKGAEHLEIDSKELKKYWSEAIAGFANNEGGLLIFGIDARKDAETGIDCASAFSLVGNPSVFESRLRELASHATDPPVNGIEYVSVVYEDVNKGFVVCYIPESAYKPHRAESAGRNYYLRSGDSFQIPSPSLLRKLFYPETKPILLPFVTISNTDDPRWISLILQNRGTSTAKNISIHISYTVRSGRLVPIEGQGWKKYSKSIDGKTVYRSEISLHPGEDCHVIQHSFRSTQAVPYHDVVITIVCDIFCENAAPFMTEVHITRVDIEDHKTIEGNLL